LQKAYSVYGGIYISKVAALKKWKTFYQKRTIPYLVERWQNYEIDDIYDFICVEAVLKQKL
jgi:CMP-N,N'-diacetyllegionaminic acid synthase